MSEPEIIPRPERAKRPSEFTDEIFQQICDRMAEGKGLREICRDPDMPSRTTFLRWIEKDTGRENKYTKAREALMDWYAEEILEIAWDDSQDTIPATKTKAARCNNEWVQRSRLKVDTIKFLMAKLHPKRYGDRLPETEGAKDADAHRMQISWKEPERIERIIINGVEPVQDDDGSIIDCDDPAKLRARIRTLEERLGMKDGRPHPPKLLTYDPGPLPSRMDGEIVTRLVGVIKRRVSNADQRAPESVLDEIMTEFDLFLAAKSGKADAAA
jgi:hypothetical protein